MKSPRNMSIAVAGTTTKKMIIKSMTYFWIVPDVY